MDIECKDCKYFQLPPPDINNLKGPKGGLCVRFPPTVHTVMTQQGMAVTVLFPTVQEKMGCGEFAPSSPMFGQLGGN